ncbi:MAG TPA: hypothetical protein VNJ01_10785 [Bacteriovoracaceae bacterium]|nr:hypothetical protein [Bacteriovoracaceae bacterium]
MEIQHENELIQSLQCMISAYLDKNGQLTLNALAQRSNVPVTTLRRLMSGQQKNEIAPHSVLNLVSYVLREKNLQALLGKLDSSVAEFLRKHFGNFIFSSETRQYNCDLNSELKDQTKYLIYKLSANHNGTDLMTIVENFGAHGKKKAEEMIAAGLLLENYGRLHAGEKNFSLDLGVAAEHLPALVRFYKPDTIAEGKNSFFSMSEALTMEAIVEIKKIQRDCVEKMHAMMNRPESLGTVPYFTINLSETLLSETTPGDLQ